MSSEQNMVAYVTRMESHDTDTRQVNTRAFTHNDRLSLSTQAALDLESKAAQEFNAKPLKQRLKILFSDSHYKRLLPFIMLWVLAGYMPSVFFTAWGAGQYSGCSARTKSDETASCTLNYNGYNKIASIFQGLGGAMSFIFGGLIGRISDSYGRKPIFYMNIILSALKYFPLVFFPNIWLFWIMLSVSGLNSSDNSFTPMMLAYISDIMPPYQRTIAYSVAYALCGIALFVGVGLAITLSILFGDESNFIAIAIIDVIQIMYCYFVLPESLKVEARKPFTTQNLNPLRPLYQCCFHPIVLWIAVVQFCISLPETGILDMAMLFVLDQLSIQNELDANIANSMFIVSVSIGLLFGNLFLLPKLQSKQFSNMRILCIGVALLFVSFMLFSLLQWFKSLLFSCIGGVFISSGFIAFPAANGIVTAYLSKSEQGIGFGVIFAVRSLTWILAPISFSQIYSFSKEIGLPAMLMYMAAIMVSFAFLIVLFPLRNALNNVRRGKYSFSTNNLQMLRPHKTEAVHQMELQRILRTETSGLPVKNSGGRCLDVNH
eukprot:404347_1